MTNLDIRKYLYHGITGNKYLPSYYDRSYKDAHLKVLESILRDGTIFCDKEALRERQINTRDTHYTSETGLSPRISFGFYPINDEIFKKASKHTRLKCTDASSYLREYLGLSQEENLDEYVMSHFLNKDWRDDYAWLIYNRAISLILDPALLEDYKVSEVSSLNDEICVENNVDLRKYLVAVALYTHTCNRREMYRRNDDIKDILKWYEWEVVSFRIDDYKVIYRLLKKYNYDVPIVDFLSGKEIVEPKKDIIRIRKQH